MALPSPTDLAVLGSVLVAVMASIMAYLGWRSFTKTRNPRLIFIVVAFIIFILKSFFVAYNVKMHAVPHDSIEFVSSLFDVIIVLLMFIPFFLTTNGRRG